MILAKGGRNIPLGPDWVRDFHIRKQKNGDAREEVGIAVSM